MIGWRRKLFFSLLALIALCLFVCLYYVRDVVRHTKADLDWHRVQPTKQSLLHSESEEEFYNRMQKRMSERKLRIQKACWRLGKSFRFWFAAACFRLLNSLLRASPLSNVYTRKFATLWPHNVLVCCLLLRCSSSINWAVIICKNDFYWHKFVKILIYLKSQTLKKQIHFVFSSKLG